MTALRTDARSVERGSAMILAVLVMAIMTLLGISYLLMADTENRIAENERLAAQALYFGEGTVREVKRWFDRPPYGSTGAANLVEPLTTVVDRTRRRIDTDGDGPAAYVAADGTSAFPFYKWGVDRDGDGHDDIFDKPYRSALKDMLVGTEDGPDLSIDRDADAATAAFLDELADKIAPNFPAAAAGIRARVTSIDVYAPPYLDTGGTWTRYGVATVKATVEIVRATGASTQVLATRVVKAVLNETPYRGPFGPLHSCGTLNWNGAFGAHWGTSTAVGDADPNSVTQPDSIPRAIPPTPRIDLLNGWQSPGQNAVWDLLKSSLEADRMIEDPWWRLIVGGVNHDFSVVIDQQISDPSATTPDGSNNFHRMGSSVGCPEYDYDTWKQIARSGGSDVHYFAWAGGTSFQENGTGTARPLRTLTDNQTGLFFFDTKDGLAPDAMGTNLTPKISLAGGSYGVRGMVYVNTSDWETKALGGREIDMRWPGEPYRDSNQNGVYDSGEDWINLNFATISTTNPEVDPRGAASDAYDPLGGGVPIRNSYGPAITGRTAAVWGILYVAGTLDAVGDADYYGSVITQKGMSATMSGTPDFWWDPRILDEWPPPDWGLPRVIITRWATDL